MDYLVQGIVISVDTLVFAYFLNSLLKAKNSLLRLETVPQIDVDSNLSKTLQENGGNLPYACLRGNIKALSPALHSFNAPSVTGVIQKITTQEHLVERRRSGFWLDSKRVINEMVNSIPFAVQSNKDKVSVEVVDALAAKILTLEVVADRFDPATSGFLSTIWQIATGVRKTGVQTIEEMLKEDTLITVVGEVVGASDSISVIPPTDGTPFFITTMPIRALMRRVESDIKFLKWKTVLFGALTIATVSYTYYKYQKRVAERKQADGATRDRRKRVRNFEDLPEDKICVVCMINPKEVILLPCGHVCLCVDCSDKINDKCPVCNQAIHSRNQAYIA